MPATKLYRALHVLREMGWFAVLSPRALRVLLVLLDYYNWGKGRAWPSYETLCRDTGLSRSAVSEALKELEFYGLLRIDRTRPGESGPKRLNIYRLPETVPAIPQRNYQPGAAWSRPERLAVLRSAAKDNRARNGNQSRAVDSDRSRALNSDQSRAPVKDQSSALGGNNVLNYVGEQRSEQRRADATVFHTQTRPSPNGEEQRTEASVRRYRAHLAELGDDPRARDAVARALAADLKCSEARAGELLRTTESRR